jgi:hypothetical protein
MLEPFDRQYMLSSFIPLLKKQQERFLPPVIREGISEQTCVSVSILSTLFAAAENLEPKIYM